MHNEEILEPESSESKCCYICLSPINASYHFGAVSCLACAAFFRRTVSLNIQFKCTNNKQCKIYYEKRILCKACRYDRCIIAGMKPQCVQKRKNNYKKMNIEISRSQSPVDIIQNNYDKSYFDNLIIPNTSQNIQSQHVWSVSSNSSQSSFINDHKLSDSYLNYNFDQNNKFSDIRNMNLLQHFVMEERNTATKRKVMFSTSPLDALMSYSPIPFTFEDLTPFTMKSHTIHMRFDNLLAFEYSKNLPGFHHLSDEDRVVLFRYCTMNFCALDIAFLTSQMKMVDDGLIVFTNATYSSVFDKRAGWDNEDEITSEEKDKLIRPLYQQFYTGLIKPMTKIHLNQTEYAALKALTLWRTCYFELSPEAKILAKEHEYSIIQGLHNYYKDRNDGPERMGTVILFISNIFELYQLIIEQYKQIEVFNLIQIDMFVRELLRF